MQNFTLANRIKDLCKEQKITVKLLLEQCEMNRNTMYDLEKKGSFPSGDKLSRIADYLSCSVDYLLGRTDRKEMNIMDNKELLSAIAKRDAFSEVKKILDPMITKYGFDKLIEEMTLELDDLKLFLSQPYKFGYGEKVWNNLVTILNKLEITPEALIAMLDAQEQSDIHSVEEEYAPSFIAAQGGEKTDSKPLTESELIDIDKLADDEQ